MNKYLAVSLLVCVAAFAAQASPLNEVSGDELESSAGFNPTNDDETSALDDNTRIFSDYCISSRDIVVGDIRTKSNTFASKALSMLFNSAENIGLEAVNVQRDATEKLAEQIRDPSGKIADYDHDDEVASIVAEGQKSIQENPSRSIFAGIASVLAATKNVISSRVLSKFEEFKGLLKIDQFSSGIKEACNRVSGYELEIQNLFEQTKAALVESNPAVSKITIEQVPCVTARRIIRLDGVCKFAMAAYNPLIKAITYQPMPEIKQ